MSNKNALIAAGVLVTVAVGGLGWRALRDRNARKEPAKLSQSETEERKVAIRQRLAGNVEEVPVASVIVNAVQETLSLQASVEVQETLEVPAIVDEVKIVEDQAGEVVVSVSRPRIGYADRTTESASTAPEFWRHFERNIRRTEVIHLTDADFSCREKLDMNKGWHRCTLNDMPGIMHVTKGNVSCVINLTHGDFVGISSSPSRFGGKGMVNLSTDQAKNFINGR